MEVGCGPVPVGLLGKAQRSVKMGKTHRAFFGVDKSLDVEKLLKKAKVKRLPENLFLSRNCAIRALKGIVPESMDIIFGSYLWNSLARDRASCALEGRTCEAAFFELAGRALKPGGRLVLVQDKGHVPYLRSCASAFGACFHSVEIPDEAAKKSPAKFIRWKSTLELRQERVSEYIKKKSTAKGELEKLVRRGVVKDMQDAAKPTIIIMRKPKPGEQQERVIYISPEDALRLLARLLMRK